jgi:uncharacterized FlaG/YvyC family protein
MRVSGELPNSQMPSDQTPASITRAAQNASGTVNAPKQEPESEVPIVNPAANADKPSVTFRRDSNGRIYYVVSDPQSGDEIEEVPPETVREVADGIEDYLKQGQTKSRAALNTKG